MNCLDIVVNNSLMLINIVAILMVDNRLYIFYRFVMRIRVNEMHIDAMLDVRHLVMNLLVMDYFMMLRGVYWFNDLERVGKNTFVID